MRRGTAVVVALLVAAAIVLQSTGARAGIVANPGTVKFTVDKMTLSIGSSSSTYDAAGVPTCADGIDDDTDTDTLADFPADPECASALDDSEAKPGLQPRVVPSFTGTVAADGTVTIPANGVVFSPGYLESSAAGGDGLVTVTPRASQAMTGSINPATGALSLRLRMVIDLDATNLPAACMVGSTSSPIDLQLKSANAGGVAYNLSTAMGTATDTTYVIPKTSGCGFVASFIDDGLGLPSPSGQNVASFTVKSDPALQAGTPDPTTTTTTRPPTTTTTRPPTTTTTRPPTTTTTRPPTTTTVRPTTTTTAKTATQLAVSDVVATASGSAYKIELKATLLTVGGSPIRSGRVKMTTDKATSCTATTNAAGFGMCRITVRKAAALPTSYAASYAGDRMRLPSTSATAAISYPA